ncbi:MAG: hypothetical protein BA066_07465 [Candidatus Korarchaeota archaeon NZ13-K]|nr:MAG: hypothetical protein BA066_07465 [Candidatus Korarchaeota archaeon NZ13-K]
MTTQARSSRLYAILYPECLTDGGGPLSIADVAELSRANTVGLIAMPGTSIPKPFSSIVDFAVEVGDLSHPLSLIEILSRIAESFTADQYILVTKGFRYVSAAQIAKWKHAFAHQVLAMIRMGAMA